MAVFQKTESSPDPVVMSGRQCTRFIPLFFLLLMAGCSDRSAGAAVPDGSVDDGSTQVDASLSDGTLPDVQVVDDGGLIVTDEVGWYSGAFEHTGFIAEQDIDPETLDQCNAYLMPLEGREMWWTYAPTHDYPLALNLFPSVGGLYEEIGLIRASGTITELGQHGHMGAYDREFIITEYTLLTCETVSHLNHCVVPRSDDLCVLPPAVHDTRTAELWRESPGPNSELLYYTLSIVDNEGVADGETIFTVHFALPTEVDPDAEWEVFDFADLQEVTLVEDRLWFAHQIIHYENLDGWVMRNADQDRLKISLSGSTPVDGTRHIWIDKEVDGEIGYP